MKVDQALQTFIDESEELLADIEQLLASSTTFPLPVQAQEELLRKLHTLKGSAGIFGFKNTVDFTHCLEQALTDGSELTIVELLSFHDHLKALISAELTEDDLHNLMALNEKSQKLIPKNVEETTEQETEIELKDWQVKVKFDPNVMRDGVDPASLIQYFKNVGQVSHLQCDMENVPELSALAPTSCYVSYQFQLTTDLSQKEIKDAFSLIENDSEVQVKLLIKKSTLLEEKESKLDKSASRASVRVDAEKLDELIDLVGELVIAGANNKLLAKQIGDMLLDDANEHMSGLIERVRDSALCLRMVPISQVFNKFYRVVQDLKIKTNKLVELEIFGEDTELDRGLMEKVVDPLMHMLRNAIDHGVELPEDRVASGKAPVAKVTLSACHHGGSIHIEVKDDGRGLNKEKILCRAKELGISDDLLLSEHAIYQLIFEQGFSTATEVSEISGRGVGMDVVKSNITSMHGEIDVKSQTGVGTCFTIHLPLTLAIIDGFLVRVAQSSFVLHRDTIIECVDVDISDNQTTGFINLRDEILPYICLNRLFGEVSLCQSARQSLVVVRFGEERIGLVVEELMGEVQTVIKPLGTLFKKVGWIIGSTILGSGEVAVILDVAGLIKLFRQNHAKSVRSTKFK